MRITEADTIYLQGIIDSIDTKLAELKVQLEIAASYGDLKENYQYEQVKGEYDPLMKQRQSIETILTLPILPVIGHTLSLGQRVKITLVGDYGEYKDIESLPTNFRLCESTINNTYVISELPTQFGMATMIREGYLGSVSPIIAPVLNLLPGEYDITLPNGLKRRYLYEIVE